MKNDKIIPCIWFTAEGGKISEVIEYYKNIFGDEFVAGTIIPLGNTPTGNAEMCEITIFGNRYSLLSTQNEHHALNDAISFMIRCKDQEEIDKYWNYFTAEGEESMCSWCFDKFGLRWQIVPENMSELMSLPNSFEVMMKQKKIIIAEYK